MIRASVFMASFRKGLNLFSTPRHTHLSPDSPWLFSLVLIRFLSLDTDIGCLVWLCCTLQSPYKGDIKHYKSLFRTRLGQLGANISPDRSSLTPQVLIGNFLKHNYPLLYELQHINLLCLYLPKKMVYPQTPNT